MDRPPMLPGLGSFTFTWAIGVPGHPPASPLTALTFLHEARRLGAPVIQVCDNLPLADLPPAELDTFQAAAGVAGIRVEIGTRGIAPEALLRNLRLAARFQSPLLRVVIDHHQDQPTPAHVVHQLRPLLPAFADAGVRLAIENHDRFDSITLARIIEDLGPDHVGVCLDTVNSFGALEGPEQVVSRLGAYTLSLHVKDFTIRRVSHQMGFTIEGCAAGTGRLNLPWLLQSLAATARCPFNAILETWVTPSASLDETITRERAWTESGFAYLRDLVHAQPW